MVSPEGWGVLASLIYINKCLNYGRNSLNLLDLIYQNGNISFQENTVAQIRFSVEEAAFSHNSDPTHKISLRRQNSIIL
ncbi:hypothetical protein E2C01_068997 [Portunus trituberculatus]|uniref:Uncharacterized protein n=1 Tax=Portunus trituberculatus TaxID=210409 RepID=A0A5B7HY83_PORTR|nr:hypothetical protein [Portunus trituberculatus]